MERISRRRGHGDQDQPDGEIQADEDELFIVIRGELTIELRDGQVTLGPGEIVVIPKGVEHRPVARDEAHLMLIEPKDIRHTGDVITERTVRDYARI